MDIELINEMEKTGFMREQTMALDKVIESDLATKQDIRETDAKIEFTKAELKRDIAEIKREMVGMENLLSMKMVIASGGCICILTALVAFAKLWFMAPVSPVP